MRYMVDQIEAGLWTGSLTLSRLLLKKSLLNELVDVPIALHHCCISQIEIIIPWNEIFDENSIISIRIEGKCRPLHRSLIPLLQWLLYCFLFIILRVKCYIESQL